MCFPLSQRLLGRLTHFSSSHLKPRVLLDRDFPRMSEMLRPNTLKLPGTIVTVSAVSDDAVKKRGETKLTLRRSLVFQPAHVCAPGFVVPWSSPRFCQISKTRTRRTLCQKCRTLCLTSSGPRWWVDLHPSSHYSTTGAALQFVFLLSEPWTHRTSVCSRTWSSAWSSPCFTSPSTSARSSSRCRCSSLRSSLSCLLFLLFTSLINNRCVLLPSAFPQLRPVRSAGDGGAAHPLPAASGPQTAALVLLLPPAAQNQGVLPVWSPRWVWGLTTCSTFSGFVSQQTPHIPFSASLCLFPQMQPTWCGSRSSTSGCCLWRRTSCTRSSSSTSWAAAPGSSPAPRGSTQSETSGRLLHFLLQISWLAFTLNTSIISFINFTAAISHIHSSLHLNEKETELVAGVPAAANM